MQRLLAIMSRLRSPSGGCPWDLEQNFSTIAPYTIEEAYEVAEAINRNDMEELKEELGDLLFQVVFHAQMASEAGHFNFDDVVEAVCSKMIRRHPHVFAADTIRTAEEQTENWERLKAAERTGKPQQTGTLANIPAALPALMRAQKLQSRAARTGFDWPDITGVIAKIREELAEVEAALAEQNQSHITEEVGDLLFAVTNLARFTQSDAESALRATNQKFTRRFEAVERGIAAAGKTMQHATLEEMEALWNAAKQAEHKEPGA